MGRLFCWMVVALTFYATTGVAETMRFVAPFGEIWTDFVELTETDNGLAVSAFFETKEEGLMPEVNLQDIGSITTSVFDYQHDGQLETIELVVNELDVLEIGFVGAVWLVKEVYVPGTPPPARPRQ